MTYYNNEKKKANLALWEQVSKTNPAHTKPVSFGRGFTAIDAHSQIMCATEAFGPVGIGWGYNVEYQIDDKMLIAFVSIWQQDHANSFGPICSIAPLYNKKGQLDDDAGKKAMTDALTKGLSHLGFNADVFLGKFDDNKYVNERNIEIQKEQIAEIPLPKDVKKYVEEAKKLKTLKELESHWEEMKKIQKNTDPKVFIKVKGIITELVNNIKTTK